MTAALNSKSKDLSSANRSSDILYTFPSLQKDVIKITFELSKTIEIRIASGSGVLTPKGSQDDFVW